MSSAPRRSGRTVRYTSRPHLPSGSTFPGGIVAVNPNGTLKWKFAQPAGTGGGSIIAGPGVGPDGNVYAVAELNGLGVFSLTPEGVLRWNDEGPPFGIRGSLGFEIPFDAANGQFYFQTDQYGIEPQGKIYAMISTATCVFPR